MAGQPPAVRAGDDLSGYNRELVQQLLPAAWDESYAYGMSNPAAPDADMPRSKPDPKVGGTLFAHLADIKSAWAKAPVPHEERVALLLRIGFDWTVKEVGAHQGVSHQAVSQRVERGVGRICSWLNGTEDTQGEADIDSASVTTEETTSPPTP